MRVHCCQWPWARVAIDAGQTKTRTIHGADGGTPGRRKGANGAVKGLVKGLVGKCATGSASGYMGRCYVAFW